MVQLGAGKWVTMVELGRIKSGFAEFGPSRQHPPAPAQDYWRWRITQALYWEAMPI